MKYLILYHKHITLRGFFSVKFFYNIIILHSYGNLNYNYYFLNIVVHGADDLTSKTDKREDFKYEMKDALGLIGRLQTGHRPAFEKFEPVPELKELISKCWSSDMN